MADHESVTGSVHDIKERHIAALPAQGLSGQVLGLTGDTTYGIETRRRFPESIIREQGEIE